MSRNRRQAKRRIASAKLCHRQAWFRRYLRALSGGVTAATIGAGSLLGQPAQAATDTWIGNTAGANWATPANWSTNPSLPQTGDSLVFGLAGTAGTVLNDNLTTSATYTFGTITFNNNAPTYTIDAAAGTRGFTFNVGSITNTSTNVQNFDDNITVNTSATLTMTSGGGNLTLGGNISGPGSLITSGAGTLTLSGNNSFANGVTLASGDALDIDSATAIGTGTLTFAGSATLDNTSADAITLSNNNAVNINGDLNFVGTENLNFGTGTVTLGGGSGQRIFTINGSSTLTTGVINSVVGSGSGIIKAGTGTWTIAPIAGNLPAQTSTVEGTLTVSAGRVNIGQDDAFFGGLEGSGIVANGSNTTRWLTVGSDNANTTFSGSLIDGGSGHLGLRKRGTGTLTLTGTNTLSDQITVEGGTLDIAATGSITPVSPGANLVVGDSATPAIIRLDGGTLQVQTIALGTGAGVNGNNTDNRSGAFYQTGGTLQLLNEASINNFRIGDGANGTATGNGGYGYYGLSGGTVNLAEFAVGGGNNSGSGNIGVMDMTGGTLNDQGWVTIARGANATGILNIIGSSPGNPNNPVINLSQGGGGQILYSTFGDSRFYAVTTISNGTMQCPVGASVPLNLSNTTNGNGLALGAMNLNSGGLLRVGSVSAANNITPSGGATYLNFNGGTLQSSVTNTSFLAGTAANNITGIVVYGGGGTIDNNSFNIVIGHPMVAPDSGGATTGITNIAVDSAGSGYIGAPAVVLSGAGATDATAMAVMVDDGSGNGTYKIDHIVMTSPGIGNGTQPTVTLVGGGTATPGSVGQNLTDFTFASNVGTGGGMTYKGSGVTTLDGVNTYTGNTTIAGGTLSLFTGGSLTSNVNINGAGAKFVTNTAVTSTVTVTNGTLDGIGTLTNVVVPIGGGTVSNGGTAVSSGGSPTGTIASSATGINIGTLTYNGTGTWAPVTSDANASAGTPSLTVGTLTLNGGVGSVAVSPINIAGTFTNNTYTLAKYTTINGTTGFAALTPNVVGLGGRQTETLTNNTGNSTITLTIGGSYLIWNTAVTSNWQLGGPSDWNLSQGLTATTYQSTSGIQDAVVFDDTAGAGSKTVNISNGDVAPPRVTFNNTTAGGSYTINGTNAIAGSGSLFVNGTGVVNINTANTFTGGVTVSNSLGGSNVSGTLGIGSNTAIGSSTLTLGLKATIDAIGADRTLTNNNAQIWNGDINFTGSNNLNMGTGAVKININSNNTTENATTGTVTGGVPTASTVNVAAKTLTIGGPISGPGVSLVKQGAGTLVLNGAATYSQQTIVHAGELQTAGGLGTINQNIQISPLGSAGDNGTFTVLNGTVNANIIYIAGSSVGTQFAGSGTMNIDAGVVNTGGTTNSLIVGSGGPAGTQTTHPATGTLNISGGTLNVNFQGVAAIGDLEVGRNTGMTGIVNQTNGAVNIQNTQDPNNTSVSGLDMLGNGATAATYNMNGGNLTIYSNAGITPGAGGIRMGVAGSGTATFNLNGGTVQTQFVNKDAGGATGIFNFNGGTLKAAQNNLNTANVGAGAAPANDNNGGGTGFMSDLTAANVLGGGAILDNNGVQMGISQGLIHGAAGPATDGGLTAKGIGTLALSGISTYNGGTLLDAGTLAIDSASAIGTGALTINGASTTIDNITGGAITLTTNNAQNWSNDFSFGGSASLNMGTGAVTLNATRTLTTNLVNAGATLTIGGVISGVGDGLIKAGAGNLALSGASNYTGPTTVKGGTLSLTGSGVINSSSGITVSGGRLLQTSSSAMTPIVTLSNGSVDGTGTINTVNVANTFAATVTHGNGTVAPITIGSLSFGGAATASILTSDATASIAKIATTNLSTSSAGNIVINAVNTGGSWTAGTTYELFGYSGSIGGAGFSKFVVGQFTGLGAHETVTLTNPSGFIDAVIGGDTLIWTGSLDGTWTSASQSAPHNWKLSSTGAGTDFFTNDAVSFKDGASTGTVNITANVSAASVQFANSSQAYTLESTGGFGLVQGSVSITGGGVVTIANNNTYSGGTTLSNGTLNLQSAGALGAGTLTIAAGTLNNTSSGGALTLTNNIQENWSGDFTFTGSNDLNIGTGAVTLSGSGTTRSVNVANGDLTVGPISGSLGITLPGPGTLTIDSSNPNNGAQSNITGEINITGGGKLQIGSPTSATSSASDFNAGGLTGNGTVENGSTGNPGTTNIVERWLILNNSANDVFSGVLQDGAGGVNGRLGLSKSGAGSLTLSGVNTLSGAITVAGGQMILTGTIQSSNNSGTANGPVNIGTNAIGQNGILTVQNGTLIVPKNNAPSIQVGGGPNTAGVLQVNGASANVQTTSELWLSTADSGYGSMDITNGSVTVGSWLAVARGGGVGLINMSGGTLNLNANALTIGSLGGATGDGIVHGQVNLTGGQIITNSLTSVFVGEQANGVLNVSGTGLLTVGGTEGLAFARGNAAAFGIMNLGTGGMVQTATVHPGQVITGANVGGTGTLNFHGGTLQATSSDTFTTGFDFMPANGIGYAGTLNVYSYRGGAIIDDGGNNISIDLPIQAPTGNGVSAAGLAVSGSGFVDTPAVQITGGGGTGATANAVIDANGHLTGIVITNPGVDYTSAPTFALVGGGVNNTGAISGTDILVSNTSGGLTKLGNGTLNLTAVSTYTGPTSVAAGTLHLGIADAISSASNLQMAGGTFNTGGFNQSLGALKVIQTSTIDMSSPQAAPEILNFANSRNVHWTNNSASTPAILNIVSWNDANTDQIIFPSQNSLNANQLNQIEFNGSGFAQLVHVTGGYELEPSATPTPGALLYGDVNQDGHVDASDLVALEKVLINIPAYENGSFRLGGGLWDNSQAIYVADINYDDTIDNADVQALINYLKAGNGSTTPTPEPDTLVLLFLGSIPGLWMGRKLRRQRASDSTKNADNDADNQGTTG
ncbi:MAG TPA: autotransporter-associated beta strand repeat-containing protein [Pirellulales bacterium]|jgi:autotransporter-associated beta strand protein|nr:autotransporter-associated beta strand repeat-containing protein [Pirellulales bacterium]